MRLSPQPLHFVSLLGLFVSLSPCGNLLGDLTGVPGASRCFAQSGEPAVAEAESAEIVAEEIASAEIDADVDIVERDPAAATALEEKFISSPRQLTFEGKKAGEGYFNQDATKMVFQSVRGAENPFYQIYMMDLETGDLQQVSPGIGKTTCGWIHPSGEQVLFASTHEDPEAKAKQEAMLRDGPQSRYSWDYDPTYELFAWNRQTGEYTQLTDTEGYDAEGAYSPDGSQIVFASNRLAYSEKLSEREQAMMDMDPAYMMDIYIMNADGTNLRRLTETPGYDGGPFFSPDGQRICWRRFSENGATAEIFTMRADGSDVRRLTSIGAMSWAPFFHPSGDYLVFTTNVHGFANFELYLVRADGKGEPVRVTRTAGFDGLPVFLPGGERISWTSTRTADKQSQIFLADWNDAQARQALGLNDSNTGVSEVLADMQAEQAAGAVAAQQTQAGFSAADVGRHVAYLTREELAGRMTGTDGERRATAYVAAYLENLGLKPAGDNGTFFHEFEFPAGAALAGDNELVSGDQVYKLDRDWRPLSFSGSGKFEARPIVFAGYGMVVPESDDFFGYDSFVHLDVEDKWVLMYRDLPQDISSDLRQQIARYSSARRKVMAARERGAYGVIFVAGPTSKVSSQLIRFESDASAGGTSLPVVSVTNEVAQRWLKVADKDLGSLQKSLDGGEMAMGFEIDGASLAASIGIEYRTGVGRNVIARLQVGDTPTLDCIMIGAHVDHLGVGRSSSSLAQDNEREQIHYGADDNASGVGAMLEIAQYLAAQVRTGELSPRRDLLIAAWSGEELGLFGSQAYAGDFYKLNPASASLLIAAKSSDDSGEEGEAEALDPNDPHAGLDLSALGGHGSPATATPLYPAIAAYLNLDMVGRLREKLIVQGIGSSPAWSGIVQRRNVPVGLALQLDRTATRLPTDAAVFVGRGVPSLAAFTGAHEDYHTPRDTADKLNYEGASQIARLFALIARGLWTADEPIEFKLDEGEAEQQETPRVRLTAYLGTIPDYAGADLKGVKLSGVGKAGPAEKAGIKSGDVIVELAGRTIENIYDYTFAIEGLKIGETVQVVIMRGEERLTLDVTPGSRE
ncbi:M28 family peptidase [Planctomycetaceae bacterium SH139]